ncbi:zinc finger X-chromosomal protein-like [Diaphorina citri]|uniref:Zinc finger X-chromosomal protein-like n=1 Tax=Diaphorina citri TaxID=121845 RepID=A0A3Q0JLP6_DIACI|nr:zinc finger X-chromosomal protein-like [Diaphorina citri]
MSRPSPDYKYVCFKCSHHTSVTQRMEFHVRTHTGEKPFGCEHCDYRSKQPNDLTRHMKLRHPNVPVKWKYKKRK